MISQGCLYSIVTESLSRNKDERITTERKNNYKSGLQLVDTVLKTTPFHGIQKTCTLLQNSQS
jgi:hypothetical protein